MWIKELETFKFRNLEDGRVQFESGLNWLCGDNGQGKTNCLEAAYFVLTGKSFRASRINELVSEGKKETQVNAQLVKGKNTWEYGVSLADGKTTRMMGGKPCKSIEFFKTSSILSFTARSKNLVDGSPDDRRRFLNRMICCLEPEFMLQLSRYRKVHGQLRQILLQRGNLGVYRGFKSIAGPIALSIVNKRRDLLEQVCERADEIYRNVFLGEGSLLLEYKTRGVPEIGNYEKRFLEVSASELLNGKSGVGPHLDDLDIRIKTRTAKRFASSGQVRAIVLSVKIAVREAYNQRFGTYPILLLDDIDAELDSERLKGLLNYLKMRGQTLISTSKYVTMKPLLEGYVYVVEAGRMSSRGMMNDK